MRLTATLLLLFIYSFAFPKTPVSSTVDQRVELLSVIFRLAGNPEYNMKFAKNYIKDINDYFEKYKDQPVITFAKKLSEEKNMGFSKVMFLAANLELKDDKFSLIAISQNTLTDKWDNDDAVKFVGLMNDFYKTTAFEVFFNRHKEIYQEATTQFDLSTTGFDQKWYLDYYGDQSVDYRTIVGLANGGANYGPSAFPVGQKKIVYAIMGSWTFDEAGKPLYPRAQYMPTLVHEFNHSFVNHILDEDNNEKLLQASGEILIHAQKKEMKLEAYEDWKSLINESLVRASVVRYLIDHKSDDKVVQDEILEQTNKGFLWTKGLVSLLGKYEASRDKYPTFKSFYPQIITFFNETARNIKKIKAAYIAQQPKIRSIYPFKNGAKDVDPSLAEMVINFDQSVTGNGSIRFGELGKEHSGVTKIAGYLNDNHSGKLALKLKPNTDYEFIVSGNQFKSEAGYSLQDYTVKFRTREK